MTAIDEYLNSLDSAQQKELQRIRELIKQIVPEAEEIIGYGMPVFKYKGKYLLGIAAFKKHLSLFPGSEVVEILKAELDGFKLSKGTIQFTLENPVSTALVKQIVKIRVQAIDKN